MPRQASGRYLLSGLLYCPACGSRMSGRSHPRRTRRYGCNQSERPGGILCTYSALAPDADAAVLREVATVLDPLTVDSPLFRAVLKQQWQRLRQTEGAGNAEAAQRIRGLESQAERARERLKKAALLLVDDRLDKAGYELVRGQAQPDLDAAEAELILLRGARMVETLPPLEMVLESAAGWARALSESPIEARRDVLAALIERIVPRRAQRKVTTEITWTTLGAALCDSVQPLVRRAS